MGEQERGDLMGGAHVEPADDGESAADTAMRLRRERDPGPPPSTPQSEGDYDERIEAEHRYGPEDGPQRPVIRLSDHKQRELVEALQAAKDESDERAQANDTRARLAARDLEIAESRLQSLEAALERVADDLEGMDNGATEGGRAFRLAADQIRTALAQSPRPTERKR